MSIHLRCPMCGRPLYRVPGLERSVPHSRGWECPQGHASSTPTEAWEDARVSQFAQEVDRFLHPTDTVECPGHDWTLIELNETLGLLQCSRCASLSTLQVRGFV